MLGVGRDLCGSSSPTLLLKQGHLQQAAQDLVQAKLMMNHIDLGFHYKHPNPFYRTEFPGCCHFGIIFDTLPLLKSVTLRPMSVDFFGSPGSRGVLVVCTII